MNLGIYRIKNIKNGKFYIGSTNNLTRRKKEHFSLLKRNKNHCKILQRAYNKYGEEAFTKLSTIDNFGWKSRVIEKLNDDKEVVKEYNSLKEYAAEHNCSIGNVGKAFKKGNKCKGFYVRYKQ